MARGTRQSLFVLEERCPCRMTSVDLLLSWRSIASKRRPCDDNV